MLLATEAKSAPVDHPRKGEHEASRVPLSRPRGVAPSREAVALIGGSGRSKLPIAVSLRADKRSAILLCDACPCGYPIWLCNWEC